MKVGTRKRASAGAVEALVEVFLPGLLSTPLIFFGLLTLTSILAVVVVIVFPGTVYRAEQASIWVTAAATLVVAVVLQLRAWTRLRHDLRPAINGLILIVFVGYTAAGLGALRFLVFQNDPSAYAFSRELENAAREARLAELRRQLDKSVERLQYVLAAEQSSSTCERLLVMSWRDHLTAIRGRFSQLKGSDRKSACTVWIVQQGTLQGYSDFIGRVKWPSGDLAIVLQKPRLFGDYRIWIVSGSRDDVGMVPGEAGTEQNLNATLREAFRAPGRADPATLVNLQWTFEQRRRDSLTADIDRQVRRMGPPPVSAGRFILATGGQFVDAFSDLITPIAIPAQVVDICIHFLRVIFFLLFFESLIHAREIRRRDGEPE